ncbi:MULTISPECIES: C-terminal binding protein [Haloarcula]|uniref:Dehydrogenase n=1 Tax=Haloarcula pellucida TaxID=1427151 RepID=A0A830GTB1_9EURY|nr:MULTISPECIES: C-terminal binding protein [Halomicroarcula]MBX0350209.1 C-terminal binding protein [Halomicroarcula pellucida]MDS0277689.1 C-terminal binding protein [Halomicroarcula sp. S1AR25-4]GGO00913.1 dehydrogenase [Halomicroarcula pellucida]
MPRVVASDDPMIDTALLREKLDAEVVAAETDDEAALAAAAEGADALVVDVNTPVTAAVLDELDDLRIVARAGVGIDNVDVGAAAENGVQVTNVPEYCTDEVATHTVTLLLDCIRTVAAYDRDVRNGNWGWERTRPVHRVRGRTLGLVSFGPIARRVREQVRGFDLDVVAYDPYVDETDMAEAGVEKVTLDDLYERADYVSLHAPLTDDTRGMVDAGALEAMQDHAVLVNTGRGGLIDEEALLDALRNEAIAAAGLDVLCQEPPEPDHPLTGLDNCIVTPHAAWYSEEAREELNATVAANVRAALAGETPPDYIDPDTDWL